MTKASKEFDTMTDYALRLVGSKVGTAFAKAGGSSSLVPAAKGAEAFAKKFGKKNGKEK